MTASVRTSTYDAAISICTTWHRKVDGKILFQDGCVYLTKRCPVQGFERELVADDIDYYRRSREIFVKPPEMPNHFNTPIKYGCPYDCGLCPDHEQHSCLSIVEITDHCNLDCPICYASSGTHRDSFRSLAVSPPFTLTSSRSSMPRARAPSGT